LQLILFVAAEDGSLEVLRFLLENGAYVNAVDKDLRTPLHHGLLNKKI